MASSMARFHIPSTIIRTCYNICDGATAKGGNTGTCNELGASQLLALTRRIRRTNVKSTARSRGSPTIGSTNCRLFSFNSQVSSQCNRSFASFTSTNPFDRNDVSGPYGSYQTEYNLSIQDPERFWSNAASNLAWFQKPSIILQQDARYPQLYKWFSDGVFNTCYNCLDVHVQNGRGDHVALYYDSPVTGNTKLQYTYAELLDQVATFAGGLVDLGVTTGDRVVIYMPMIPEALVAMLACSRIGAIHSVVFGGFASRELATRIADCQPTLVISASAGVEPTRVVPYKLLLDQALKLAAEMSPGQQSSVKDCIIVQRHGVESCVLGSKDLDYDQVMAKAKPVAAVPLPANHIHYILYTSGTTGIPKGVVRDTAGWAVALKYTMGAFYNASPGSVYWAASDIGWVVGHAYIVYGPLLQGCSTVLYEGKPVGTPDAGAYWRMIEEYGINTMFVAPTALRAIKQADPTAQLAQEYDLDSLQALFLAGEHCDPDTLHFCEHALQIRSRESSMKRAATVRRNEAIDHWWQTELGHPGVGNAIGLGRMPLRHGACSAPAPGFDVRIVDEFGRSVPPEILGDMVIKTPLPPGTLYTLYNRDEECIKTYFTKYPGFYNTGDAAYQDKDGYIHIMGRTDDLINTAGHRLSTGRLEEILQAHPEVADCAVIPVRDKVKGQVPIGFVVVNKGSTVDHKELKSELIQMVREELGPVASFKKVAVVKALPKTRSGKILRSTMAKIADGKSYTITPTIEDPEIFTYLAPEIRSLVDGS